MISQQLRDHWSEVLTTSLEFWQREHDYRRLYRMDVELHDVVGALHRLGAQLEQAYGDIGKYRSLNMHETAMLGWAKQVSQVRADTCHWSIQQLWKAFDQTLKALRAAVLELAAGGEAN